MIQNILLGLVILLVPLAVRYLNEGVKQYVRVQADRVLADRRAGDERLLEDQRHENATLLEAIRTENERKGNEAGLFARERHRGYRRIYQRYRVAADAWITASRSMDESADQKLKVAELRWRKAKNAEVLEDLYLSDAVRDYITIARTRVSAYGSEVWVQRRHDRGSIDALMTKETAMELAIATLRNVMSDELRTATDAERPKPEDWKQ